MKRVGIVPAAGYGSRLHPFRYPKELFPLGYSRRDSESPRLKVVCEYSFDCLAAAGVEEALVVISDHKLEVLRFLSDGCDFGIRLAYLHQREVNGLPYAVDCAYSWTRDSLVVMTLPDAVVRPTDSAARMLELLEDRRADLVMGVYPTEHPEDLCPVRWDKNLRIEALYDKEPYQGLDNTWGMAVWTPLFADFLHDWLQREGGEEGEPTLSGIVQEAVKQGLMVLALPFEQGCYWDIGKNSSLIRARREFEEMTPIGSV